MTQQIRADPVWMEAAFASYFRTGHEDHRTSYLPCPDYLKPNSSDIYSTDIWVIYAYSTSVGYLVDQEMLAIIKNRNTVAMGKIALAAIVSVSVYLPGLYFDWPFLPMLALSILSCFGSIALIGWSKKKADREIFRWLPEFRFPTELTTALEETIKTHNRHANISRSAGALAGGVGGLIVGPLKMPMVDKIVEKGLESMVESAAERALKSRHSNRSKGSSSPQDKP
jgi:hypothetical protein